MKIKISLRKEGNKTVKYGVEGEEYKIGLIDNHFFAIIDTPFTSYALKNFEEIKHIEGFNKIYKKSNGKYKKSNNRYIDSFTFVKLLLENKDTLLKQIPIKDFMDSQYYKHMEDNDNLEYDILKSTDVNQISKIDNSKLPIVFFDFETNTKTENHTPYLMCSLYEDRNQKIKKMVENKQIGGKNSTRRKKLNKSKRDLYNKEYVSYGKNCAKEFIKYLSNEFSTGKLIKDRQNREKGIEMKLC